MSLTVAEMKGHCNQPFSEQPMSRLIVLTPHGSVRQVNLQHPITTIGRDPHCGVHIDSLGVSRHHAAIRWNGQGFVITDMASRNGTYVNKTLIREHDLQNGDAITVGDCQLRFLSAAKPLPAVDALRLVTLTEDPIDLDVARQRSDWATFFRRVPSGSAHRGRPMRKAGRAL